MKTLLPNNRIPETYKYDELRDALLAAEGEIGVGYATLAYFKNDQGTIGISLFDNEICRIYDDGMIALSSCGYRTKVTKNRLDRAIQPLGLRLTQVRRKWFIYNVKTGRYVEFDDNMVVSADTGKYGV